MFKKLAGKLFSRGLSESSSDGFFLRVRSECAEEFHLFINKSYELMQDFRTDTRVTYTLKKEVYGVCCRNRIYVKMKFDGNKKFVSREIEHGECIEEAP